MNGSARNECIEAGDIHFHCCRAEANRIAVAGEEIRGEKAKRITKIARQTGDVVDSKERCKVVQRNGSVAMEREPDQKSLRFATADLQRISAMIDRAKFSKQTD